MNVLDLLKQDHQTVARLIDEVQRCEPDDEKLDDLAQQMSQALTIHAALEESMFYPELRDRAEETEELVDVFEAFTEHDVVKHLIALLKGRHRDRALFKAELQVLGENVKHHVREEESTIFSLARELLDEEELEEIGERAEEEKSRLMSPRRGTAGRKKRTSTRGQKKSAKKTSTRKSNRRKKSTR
jgi:hemerythrin superfamily protein